MWERVLLGHSIDDYRAIFCLTDKDLQNKLMEYNCGPTAVNYQMQQHKNKMISYDSLFSLSSNELKQEIKANMPTVAQFQKGADLFMADYELGKEEKRYLPITSSNIPSKDFAFDLALTSNFFFAENTNAIATLKELTRIAKEVRIFPVVDLQGQSPSLLGPILLHLQQENYGTELKEVSYPLHPKSNVMLRVWAQSCVVK